MDSENSPSRQHQVSSFDFKLKPLKIQEQGYFKKLHSLAPQNKKRKDDSESDYTDLDHDELQSTVKTKLTHIKSIFEGIIEKFNGNVKEEKKFIAASLGEMMTKYQLALIFQDLSNTKDDEISSCKQVDLDHEVAHFNKSYNSIFKELAGLKNFQSAYQEDKKNTSIRLNDRVRKGDFDQRLKDLEAKFNQKMEDKFASYDHTINEFKRHTSAAVQGVEDKQMTLEKDLQWRISDCENLLKSRVNETYVKDFGKILEQKIIQKICASGDEGALKIKKVQSEFDIKFENQEMANNEKLQLMKKMIFDFDSKLKLRATKEQFTAMQTDLKEARQYFEQQYDIMNRNYQVFDSRAKDNQLRIQYADEREEAIKRVPPNVENILSEIEGKIADNRSFMVQLQEQITNKLEIEDYHQGLTKKLDYDQFHKWFPRDILPSDFFQAFIKKDIDIVQKNIMDMAKFWDQKIVKLRQDMNIHAIVKRIGEKADTVEMKELFDTSQNRLENLEQTFIQIINEMEQYNKQNQVFQKQIFDLSQKQTEVSIGKRNVNCLSCAPDSLPDDKVAGADGKMYKAQTLQDTEAYQEYQNYSKHPLTDVLRSKLGSRTQLGFNNKSRQLSYHESPTGEARTNRVIEKRQNSKFSSIHYGQHNESIDDSQLPKLNYDYASLTSLIQQNSPRQNSQNSYIALGNNNTSAFVYESANELERIKEILRSKKGTGQTMKNIKKKTQPFSFVAINEMKERKRAMNHKRVLSVGNKSYQFNIRRPDSAI